ncbi:ABC-type transport auxiliary lipoprotein family protein [Accumulibacter sp.]|uniref:ABC-type transport auxiliary lipoprotein family protein n=1 Tax=Accumulibacter sp. TaxID=2053492 RepID=UPI0025F24BAA|nr:ABC-type transport auxiliary lipoprotein family protein [Accumulibacter sp.]MCP5227106.1 membrane integrity-associated transporter subunit PqiC [Accumulibacter sp.]
MKRLSVLFAACALSACVGGLPKATQPEVYDFGLPTERLAGDAGWSNLTLEVRAPYWFDSLRIAYRLLYDDPMKLRSYADSRWAGEPGLLLSQRLRQQLGLLGGGGRPAAPGCVLRLELQEFSQTFATPLYSRAVLQGTAAVLDLGQEIIAEQPIAIAQPAASADASGGVRALVAASEELGRRLADWLRALEKSGRLRNCPSPSRD